MNSKLFICSSILLFGLTLLSSCSKEEDIFVPLSDQSYQIIARSMPEEGRFDNIPFQWDYFFSTDSLREVSDGFTVYPVKTKEDTSVSYHPQQKLSKT